MHELSNTTANYKLRYKSEILGLPWSTSLIPGRETKIQYTTWYSQETLKNYT